MPNQSFPLAWPVGVPRFNPNQRSIPRFKPHTVEQAVREIRSQFNRTVGTSHLVISTNIPLRMDGSPYSNPGRMADPGAAVYFQLEKQSFCLPCDAWSTVENNLWAISKHMEAMRGMRTWGVGTAHQAFAGYKAIAATSEEMWWDVLECRPDASRDVIHSNYIVRAKSAHPDYGGTNDAMARLNVARERALAERDA